MSGTEAEQMAKVIDDVTHDLGTVGRLLMNGQLTTTMALGAVQQLTNDANGMLAAIVCRVISQPIIPGMERSTVNIT